MAFRNKQQKKGRRRSGKVLLVAALLGVLVFACQAVTGGSPASAMDGRVPDARPATREGEVTALYWHGLNRDPDSAGLQNYMSFVNNNCRWGLLDASFKLLGSAEAQAKWQGNPQTLAGMLYASLLNRPPDAGGLRTYTDAIKSRGLNWAIASMLASPEYNARLDRLCAPYPKAKESVRMYTHEEAMSFIRDILFPRAANLAKVCGMMKAVQQINLLKSTPWPPAMLVGRIAWVTNQVISMFKLDGTCGAVLTYLLAAREINVKMVAPPGNNPVLIQTTVDPPWTPNIFAQTDVVIRVGPDPAHWKPFNASVR